MASSDSGDEGPQCRGAYDSASYSAPSGFKERQVRWNCLYGRLVAEVISGQAFTIDQLHKYIGQTPS
jgi:hypothetical protein